MYMSSPAELGRLPERIPPTLVLYAKRDPKTAFAGAAALAERLDAAGDIELAASDTAAHYVLMTDPDFAIAQLRDFIAR